MQGLWCDEKIDDKINTEKNILESPELSKPLLSSKVKEAQIINKFPDDIG